MRGLLTLVTHSTRRPTVAATTAALISGLLVALGPTAATAGPAQAAASTVMGTPVVTALPSMTAAMRAAVNQGSRVEVLSMHTSQQRAWANPDGTYTVDSYAGPEWVQHGDGSWATIDTTLSVAGGGLTVEPTAAAADITLANGAIDPAGPATATVATVAVAGDKGSLADGAASVMAATSSPDAPVDDSGTGKTVSVSVGWNANLPKPTLEGNIATYTDAAPGQDLRIEAKPRGIETFVDLKTRPATIPDAGITVTLPLSAKGLTVTADTDGGYLLKDATGAVVANTPPATIWDATTDPVSGDPVHTLTVDTKVTTTATGYALSVTVPKSFLENPAVVWPVTVDPSGTIYASSDTYVEKGYNTTNFGTEDDLRVGTYDGGTHVARSLLYFPTTTITGTKVTAAYLHLYEWWSASCTNRELDIQRLSGGFTESGTTWNTQPTYPSTVYGSIVDALGLDSGCPANYLGGSTGIAMTSLVDSWAGGTVNTGIALTAASETDSLGWKRFYSSEHSTTGPRPHLTVTYDHYPATPTALVASGSVNGWVTTATPQLRATVSDPDGGNVTGRFAIYSGTTQIHPTTGSVYCPTAGGVLCASGSSVASGTASSLQAPTSILSNGGTYTFKAWGFDTTVNSKTNATSGTFRVDTTAVGTPTVSCPGLTFNGFTNPAPTTAVSCIATATVGPSGIASYTVTLDGAAVTATTAGAFTIPVTKLTNGWHTLTVTATNGAGAKSATTSLGFGLGAASLSLPADRQSTAKSMPLQVFAPAGVSAKLQYYNTGTSAWIDIASTALTTTAGGTVTQPVTLTGTGALSSATYYWDLTKTFAADTVAQVRACVMLTSTASCANPSDPNISNTTPVTATLDRSGAGAASSSLGPVQVSLTTGAASLSDTDATIPSWAGAASVGRSYMSYRATADGPFGKGWTSTLPSAAQTDWTRIDDANDYVLLYDSSGGPTGFTWNGSTYVPEADASDLHLTKTAGTATTKGYFTLTEPDGTTTTFTYPLVGAQTGNAATPKVYPLSSVVDASTAGSPTTTFTSDANGYVTDIIAPAPAGVSCNPTLQVGCNTLHLTYVSGHVSKITWNGYQQTTGGTPAQTAFAVDVACYTYDTSGRLTSEWDPREQSTTPGSCDAAHPALATTYGYDATSSRLNSLAAPGLDGWTIGYDTSGRAATATQSGLTTTLVYDASIGSTTGDGNPDLSQGAIATWEPAGTLAPVSAVALYPPWATVGDLRTATITALDAQGRPVNTASFSGTGQNGWRITSTVFDTNANQTWSLSAANRARALEPTTYAADLTPLGLTGAASTDVADALASKTVYAQLATDGVWDATDTYSPLHAFTVPGQPGVTVGRTRTHTTYGTSTATTAPGDATVMTTAPTHVTLATTTGGTAGTALSTTDISGTTTETDNAYGLPNGSGGYLTDGWTLRTPMQVTTKVPGGTDVVTQTLINSSGQTVEQRQPSFANVTSGTRPGVRVTTYYGAGNDPANCLSTVWFGQVCTQGPASGHPTATTRTSYDKFLRPNVVTDSVGDGTDRTTTTAYDNSGLSSHVASVTLTLGATTVRTTTLTYYDGTTGLPKQVTSAGVTQTRNYDTAGRITTTTDGAGGSVTTGYDTAGRTDTVTRTQNGSTVGTTTYAYNGGTERRGLTTSVSHTGVGTLTGTYDPDGLLTTQTLPDTTDPTNPITSTWNRDTTGTATDQTWTQGTNLWFADTVTTTASGQWSTDNNGATGIDHTYAYDGANRLTGVDTDNGTTCTRTTYGFDVNSNRTAKTTYPDDGFGNCQSTTGATSVATSYDAGDRAIVTGQQFDTWGRVTTLPATVSPSGAPVTMTYFADDLVASTTTGGVARTWALDPASRLACFRTAATTITDTSSCGSTTTTGVVDTTNHYPDTSSDSPAWTVTNTAGTPTTTWYADGLDGSLAAQIDPSAVTYQLTNLHGDVVATSSPADTAAWGGATICSDEYGNTTTTDTTGTTATNPRYGWLGGKQRSSDGQAGLVLMGVRLYNPVTGLFLSTDPIPGGNPNSYTYPTDPITGYDLNGKCWGWGCEAIANVARHAWDNSLVRGAIVGVAVGLVCVGSAGVGCALIAGAAIGAAVGAAHYLTTNSHRTWGGFFRATAIGAASGIFKGAGGFARSSFLFSRGLSAGIRFGRHGKYYARSYVGTVRFLRSMFG